MPSFTQTFLKGLVAILPLTATAYCIYWLIVTIEGLTQNLFRHVFHTYVPGTGVALTIVLIYLIGLLTDAWLIRKGFDAIEAIVLRVPFIKAIYKPMKELMSFFSHTEKDQMSRVVAVKIPGTTFRALGLVTQENFPHVRPNEQLVAVYLPMSYQIGGYTLFVAKEDVEEVAMTIEQAMQGTITGWLQTSKQKEDHSEH